MDGKRIVPGRLALGFTAQVEEFLSSVVSTALGDEEVEKQRRLEQCKNELLWWSAEFKRFDMWEYLLEKGADMKAKFAGKVYLHKAAYWGVIPSVERHLQRGCPVDIRDDFKLTPLFWSVAKGRTQCTDLLISNGADVLHASPWQFTNEVIQNCIFALKDSLPEKYTLTNGVDSWSPNSIIQVLITSIIYKCTSTILLTRCALLHASRSLLPCRSVESSLTDLDKGTPLFPDLSTEKTTRIF
eukprot:m.145380 g.145380  ORF g.145380 m.145380 type:complete len:242 (+) comp38420_c0_seq13:153-878(+)